MTAEDSWTQRVRIQADSVRIRSTAVTVLVVAIALSAGALALVTVLRGTLTAEVRADARARASGVAASFDSNRADLAVPVGVPDEELVQILDPAGRVVAASRNVEGRPAVEDLAPGDSKVLPSPLDEDDDMVLVAVAGDDRSTVLVGRTLVDVAESVQVINRYLIPGLAVLLVLVAAATWRGVGRALAPVERIRREVDEISASELHRRVDESRGTDEIARLAVTMNRMLDRLQRAHEAQQRFISDASHELRSPVASIRQHAEVALAAPERTTVPELAATVLAEDLRVQDLIADLLLLARSDEATLHLRRQPVDLDDLVLDEARRLRRTTSLRIDTALVSAGRVEGDVARLQQMLRNLCDNAARHARARLSFTVAEQGRRVLLTIDDDGPGIPKKDRRRVFERFVRLDDARTRDHGGSGLGLSIVAELVKAHEGEITLSDSPLGGARVEVSLPIGSDV
ncbi:sensor histidine kinase [Streptomyces chartreusis]